MTIGLTEDARDLRDSVRGWAARHLGPDVVRAAVNAKADEKPAHWLDLSAQGLLGLYVPEELGGAGAGLLELAVVVEELGRALVPGPYLPTVLAGARQGTPRCCRALPRARSSRPSGCSRAACGWTATVL